MIGTSCRSTGATLTGTAALLAAAAAAVCDACVPGFVQAVMVKSDKIERNKVVRNFIVPPCFRCGKIALE
jgi:hypothetical protein